MIRAENNCLEIPYESHFRSRLQCFDFVGHNAPVIAVKYNHSMFRRRGKQTPYNCIAIGSQDCKLSVWITNRPKALIIARQFFTQGIGDLSW
jgi:protein HIRA/HIR1